MDEYKSLVLRYLSEKDPKNDIVKIDEVTKNITYNSKILVHTPVKFEDEGYVRAYLIVKLVKELGYPIEYIELEVPYTNNIGSNPKGNTAFLDILVRDRREKEKIYLMIECKSPSKYDVSKANIKTQLFNIAHIQERKSMVKYLLYYSISKSCLDDRNIIIDFEKYKNYEDWMGDSEKEDLNIIPKDYGISYHANYARVTPEQSEELNYKPLDNMMMKADFRKLKSKLQNSLWGGGSTNYNDVFYYLMHLFLAKIYDEMKRKEKEIYEFQIYYEDGKKESSNRTFDRIERLYREAQEKLLNQPSDIIEKSTFIDLDKLQISKVIGAITLLQGISLTDNKNKSDILGQFFEDIVSSEFKQDKGQFFTPDNLVKFIIEVLEIKESSIKKLNEENEELGLLPYIIDPSCGSGTFLLEAMKEISQYYLKNKDKINLSEPIQAIVDHSLFIEDKNRANSINTWAQTYIYGIEPNVELATASKVNMILHGDGNANIFIRNGLASFNEYDRPARITKAKENRLILKNISRTCNKEDEINEQFDFIITNPPFSLTFGDETEDIEKYQSRFIYGSKKSSENLFIERWYQLLKEGGRVGAILPDSVFDTSTNKYIRLFLMKYFHINAIISVDEVAFKPYTSTKVSILFATKKTKFEVEAFEKNWNEYAKKYIELWKEEVIQLIIENDKLLNGKNGFKNLCRRYEITNQYRSNLLNSKLCTPKIYDNILEKIVNQSHYKEEYCTYKEIIDSLNETQEVCRYKALREIENKNLTKDQKSEIKVLKTNKDVAQLILIEKKIKEILDKISDYNNLEKIYTFANKNKISELNSLEAVKVLKNLLKEYYPTNYMLQTEYEDKIIHITKLLDRLKTLDSDKENLQKHIEKILININFDEIKIGLYKVEYILNNIDITKDIDLIIEDIIQVYKNQISNFKTDLEGIIERCYELILKTSELDYPDWFKTKAEQKHQECVNSWWVFKHVSKYLDKNILYAHAEEVGYKRTKKSLDLNRPNELFCTDIDGNIIIDPANQKSILDYIKSVDIWNNTVRQESFNSSNIKMFSTQLSKVGEQFFLRLDSKYRELWDLREISTVTEKLKVGDVLYKMDSLKKEKGELNEETNILDISTTESRYGKLEDSIRKVEEIASDKTILDGAEFIVSKLCMSRGYIFNNENKIENLIGSTELIPYTRIDKNINLNFLRTILLNDEYLETYSKLETGKTPSQKRVNPIDFMQLSLPDVSYEDQEKIAETILSSEKRVKELMEEIGNERNKLNMCIKKSVK